MTFSFIQTTNYWLSEHPSIVSFRWSHIQSWGSTWFFLFSAIAVYVVSATALHLLLSLLLRRNSRVPLGPIPALHSLVMALFSLIIFFGILLSSAAEIRDTRWFWRRTKTSTAFQWLLCFPLGTRPSGRVFFWSYIFYLSRFLHFLQTFFTILTYRKLNFFTLFNQSSMLLMSFIWLEFSQSFQVIAILLTALLHSVDYGYQFWTAIGLPSACFPFVVNCQVVLLGCNLVCHSGVFLVHLLKGGCNGMGAWGLNAVLNCVILLPVLRFYLKLRSRKRKISQEDVSSSRHGSRNLKEKES
ncbi:elongation of fatty acids protein 3-like [Tripterygium wilfordii]|uniref:elongation of fatty acids protein 3-like n=1 Tax=Tripterygium wilfordii TaxID=458696 RepID=UPI0018F7E514|nr:elongation of fatty acids protein 3-like [Tripterygium wilfordii]